jgi:hypothetical protein
MDLLCIGWSSRPQDQRSHIVKKVLIIISGGAVQSVQKPKGVSVEIRDYDVEGNDVPPDNDNYRQDKDGDWYQRMLWGANEKGS